MRTKAEDLKVGDTIKVWWKPGQDTITALNPYPGTLSDIMFAVATFAINQNGMSLGIGSWVDKVA